MTNTTESAVKKVVRDGKVAVLISPGYGAGWSTWANALGQETALYAPDVVEWVEGGKVGDTDFAEKYGYTGGLDSLIIEWVPAGTRFYVDEYDGSESLVIVGPDFGYVA